MKLVFSVSEQERVNDQVHRHWMEVWLNRQRFRAWEMPFHRDSAFWTHLGFTAREPLPRAGSHRICWRSWPTFRALDVQSECRREANVIGEAREA